MTDEKPVRSFLALDPPPELLENISGIQGRLKRILHGDIRWTNPAGIHLTLKFFGDISGSEIAAISRTVAAVTDQTAPFDLEARDLGVLPSEKRARIIWLGMTGNVAALMRLQKETDEALTACGFGKEERSFKPHLTLGRIKSSLGAGDLDVLKEHRDDYVAGSFTANGLSLFKSDLTPRGAVYTEMARFPFGG
jgi:2'-5' RNA ligase